MSQAEFEKLRAGVRTILWSKFSAVIKKHIPDKELQTADRKITDEFEKHMYNLSVLNWRSEGKKEAFKDQYVKMYNAAGIALANSPGPFPDQPLAIRMLSGKLTPEGAATNEILLDHENRHPRDIYRKLFVASLLKETRLKGDRENVLLIAAQIETSCYKAVIITSKSAEDPYRRHWDSAPFVMLYSNRCATVNSHIDPEGSVCRSYGCELIDRMIAGAVPPDDIGFMSAAEMCPNATKVEKLEIEIRSQQHVQEKWSDLFSCPKCKKRQCTYAEKQKRSLDEPATILCRCVCGHKFIGG